LGRAAADAGVGAGDAGAGEPETALHPPELLERAEAEYPAAAREAGVEGVVVLRLGIDAAGHVTEAEVVEAAGSGFDEAAREAALRFVFAPARRGEEPVGARVLYRYEFRLPVAGSASEPESAPESESESESVPESASAPESESESVRESEPESAPDSESASDSAVPASAAPIEITVAGASRGDRLRGSAEAATVIETDRARAQSADMGEVLARTQGVGVRRAGGLGSDTRFSLNGLTGEQVRFFLDGVPLELMGYPFGLANVPVNLVDRIEIYSGVVPVRFGADALGGAVNLVTDTGLDTGAAASYEAGSFDTHRVTLAGQYHHEPSGWFTRASGFFDYARNDFPIDVEVPDERGRPSSAVVHRFHDAYRADGANVELGYVDRPWARRLLLRVFVTDYEKEYQHNTQMTVPYGEVTYGERAGGASVRYGQAFAPGVVLDARAGYAHTRGHFFDVAGCVYDWFGRCVRERTKPGEVEGKPHDELIWDDAAFARANLALRIDRNNGVRIAVAPTFLTRTGDERRPVNPDDRDPLSAERKLTSIVSGVEYELDALDDRLENIAFVKQYAQVLDSEEPRPGGVFTERDRTTLRAGAGDGVRYRFTDWLYAKASYEFATRLPSADEIFGDNVFVLANLELAPETSHNVNLGGAVDAAGLAIGRVRGTLNGFVRDAAQLIILTGGDRQMYQNVYGARAIGFETAAGWSSPGEYLVVDGNFTYQSFRNTSSESTFGEFEGDSIPNRPNLFANVAVRAQAHAVAAARDELWLGWNARYVDEFFRSWESLGIREFKQVVPSQFVQGVGVGYAVFGDDATVTTTLEVQNLGDVKVFDFYGVQRPGRAFYAKVTAEL
jgi:TonB family protein